MSRKADNQCSGSKLVNESVLKRSSILYYLIYYSDLMKKILFLIHDLGSGGAEKVLVNLVNHMNYDKFDVTICALFGGGVNEKNLNKEVHLYNVIPFMIPGNKYIMKLFSSKMLHKICIRNHYDIEISYLEGPSARIISGCPDKNVKLVSWIHSKHDNIQILSDSFRSQNEAKNSYNKFDKTIFVSNMIKDNFCSLIHLDKQKEVLYNTIDSEFILKNSNKTIDEQLDENLLNIVTVGTLKKVKGYNRLINIIEKLVKEKIYVHLYIIGKGPQQNELNDLIRNKHLTNYITLLGFNENPYKYVAKCDLYVCSSYSEGFSTSVCEAIIVGTPVCTVDVSGMKEILGNNNEFGLITENSEESLCNGIKKLVENPDLLRFYKKQALIRRNIFSINNTISAVEKMLNEL